MHFNWIISHASLCCVFLGEPYCPSCRPFTVRNETPATRRCLATQTCVYFFFFLSSRCAQAHMQTYCIHILLTLTCNQWASARATCSHKQPPPQPPRIHAICWKLPSASSAASRLSVCGAAAGAALWQRPRERNGHFTPTDLQLLFSTARPACLG